MKKSLNKIIITSTVATTGLVSIGSIVGINSLTTSPSFNSQSNTLLQNNSNSSNKTTFNSIEEAIIDYEKKYVSTGKYIGDIYKESSASYNYRKIYLNKNEVQNYDPSKIQPTYKTSYGIHTDDIDISKKSFIEQPIVAYKDKMGNIHYTEKDANNSNVKNTIFNSTAFYEINDYSKSNDMPKKVKINPLNTSDLNELKNIAISNIGKLNSNFSISYFYANEKAGQATTKYNKPTKPGEYINLDENKKTTIDKVIYTINFNGLPLYKINHDWISDNFFTNKQLDSSDNKYYGGQLSEEMKKDPSKYLTDFIVSKLNQTNTTTMKEFFNKLLSNLENISNNFKSDGKGNLHLEKKSGKGFDRNDLMVNFVSKDVNNTEFKNKFLDDKKFSEFGISNDEINTGLKLSENDDESMLFTNTGTFKSIIEYNKSLKNILDLNDKLPEQLLKTIKSNMVSNLSDIVFLFDQNNSPWKIKYNEYPSQNLYFNESINNNSISFISSVEEKKNYIKENSSNSIETIWLVYDKRGSLLSNSFDRQVAIENAINVSKPEIDNDFVYYNKDGKNIKIKNQINELNVLQLDGQSYGFATYQELYNCLYEYIKMSSIIGGNGEITPPKPPVQDVVPFQPSDIKVANIGETLSKFQSLDIVNKLTVTEKFNNFGSAFNITDIETWNKFIGNGLSFEDKENSKLFSTKADESLNKNKTATMTVQLQNGNKFSDGKTSFSTDIQYSITTGENNGNGNNNNNGNNSGNNNGSGNNNNNGSNGGNNNGNNENNNGNIDNLPDEGVIDGKNTYSSTKDIVMALSFIIGVLLIAEVIVLTLTIINKRKRSSNELKVLSKYYKEKK